MTNIEIINKARSIVNFHDPSEPFSCDELATISAALAIGGIVLRSSEKNADAYVSAQKAITATKKPVKKVSVSVKPKKENKPLKLEELKNYEGKDIYIAYEECSGVCVDKDWLVSCKETTNENGKTETCVDISGFAYYFDCEDYGKTLVVYADKPDVAPTFPVTEVFPNKPEKTEDVHTEPEILPMTCKELDELREYSVAFLAYESNGQTIGEWVSVLSCHQDVDASGKIELYGFSFNNGLPFGIETYGKTWLLYKLEPENLPTFTKEDAGVPTSSKEMPKPIKLEDLKDYKGNNVFLVTKRASGDGDATGYWRELNCTKKLLNGKGVAETFACFINDDYDSWGDDEWLGGDDYGKTWVVYEEEPKKLPAFPVTGLFTAENIETVKPYRWKELKNLGGKLVYLVSNLDRFAGEDAEAPVGGWVRLGKEQSPLLGIDRYDWVDFNSFKLNSHIYGKRWVLYPDKPCVFPTFPISEELIGWDDPNHITF